MYWHIKKAFEEIYSIVTEHEELGIESKGLDDIPAIIYTVADFAAFCENKDRNALYSDFNGWLLNEYYYRGLFDSQDTLKEYIDSRIDFYSSLDRRKIVGLWAIGNRLQFEKILNNPIKCIVAAFIDCLIDSTYIDNYDKGRPWGDIDIIRSISMADNLLIPITTSLELLAKAICS